MALLLAWVVFPAVLGLLSLGLGLLLQRVSGGWLAEPLLLPAGFAAILVIASLATQANATASLATPAVVALAIVGFGLSLPFRRGSHPWAFVGAGAALAAYAAPIVLSGQATFAGYIKLDDTATWLAIDDRAIEHGRSLAGLAPSSYEAILNQYIGQTGYPVGSVVPLGVVHQLIGVDTAWLFQPYLAFQAALLALVLYTIAGRIIRAPWLRGVVAFIAAQATLLYGYSLWGSVKELVIVPLIALLAVLVTALFRDPGRPLSVVPIAATSAALLAVLNVGAGAWLGLALLPTLALPLRVPLRSFLVRAAIFAALTIALALPTLKTSRTFYAPASHTLTSGAEFGNLAGPLDRLQLFGIWPTGDFRDRPADMQLTYVLIAVLAGSALVGLAAAWRKRAGELVLYVAVSIIGYLVLSRVGSPWVDAKALATASPAPVAAAMIGAAFLFERGRRVEATVIAAAIGGGVLWSNALAYHEAWLAPRPRLVELQKIGQRFAGEGPTLTTDFELYGARHFLRTMDADGASTTSQRPIALVDGGVPGHGNHVDVDQLKLDGVLGYKTLVLRRSPVDSRPPSAFSLVSTGRYYEVWQQAAGSPKIFRHVPLGGRDQASSTPRCAAVLRLAAFAAGNDGRLATVTRPRTIVQELGQPGQALSYGEDPAVLYLRHPFTFETRVAVSSNGQYDVWIGGSFRARLTVAIDGRSVGAHLDQLNWPGDFVSMGSVALRAGMHDVTVKYDGPDVFHPGSAGEPPFGTGPLVLSKGTADRPVQYVQPKDARKLCGRNLDWIEAIAS